MNAIKSHFYGVDNVATVNSVPRSVKSQEGYHDVKSSICQIHHTYNAVQNVEVLDLQSH
jgi:hypothetical protein